MGLAENDTRARAAVVAAPDVERIWADVLDYLRVRVGREGFETWLAPTRGNRIAEGMIEVGVPNPFFVDWLGQHYVNEIREAVESVSGERFGVVFRAAGNVGPVVVTARREPSQQALPRSDGYRLRPRYSFDSFVVGESNRLACATARNVADQPGQNFNPLFIYGGVGLGKTHLIQAIANQALGLRPAMKVCYTAAESLFIELIQAIEKNRRLEFKSKYTGLDLLLLDDVHYLVNKERLQEEVFYIFNCLYLAGSQIVFTSDRPPQDIPALEDRLRSRMSSGLVVDIKPPELETRIAILKRKAASDEVDLPDDVACFIAARVTSSVRLLEGCLTRLLAYASVSGRAVTVDTASEALKDLIPKDEPVDHNRIITACANAYGISAADIVGERRTKHVALARQVAMYLMRSMLKLSLNEIGYQFGDRDHTTVMHALGKIEELRIKEPSFAATLDNLAKGISRGEAR